MEEPPHPTPFYPSLLPPLLHGEGNGGTTTRHIFLSIITASTSLRRRKLRNHHTPHLSIHHYCLHFSTEKEMEETPHPTPFYPSLLPPLLYGEGNGGTTTPHTFLSIITASTSLRRRKWRNHHTPYLSIHHYCLHVSTEKEMEEPPHPTPFYPSLLPPRLYGEGNGGTTTPHTVL